MLRLQDDEFRPQLREELRKWEIGNPNMKVSIAAQEGFLMTLVPYLNAAIEEISGVEIVNHVNPTNSVTYLNEIDLLVRHVVDEQIDVVQNAFIVYVERLCSKITAANLKYCTTQHFVDPYLHRERRMGFYGWAEGIPEA
jgi:hypothetical protein